MSCSARPSETVEDAAPTKSAQPGVPSGRSRPLSPVGFAAVAASVLAANLAFLQWYLRAEPAATVLGPGHSDDFQRQRVGPDWWSAGGQWQIRHGELWSPASRNNPLWLRMRLPPDVSIEFDARSESRSGDIKFEVFGNGRDHGSGYVLIFGGWGNQVSAIARLDEHGADRQERSDRKVVVGRTYHMRLERRGNELRWYVDGELFLSFSDPSPLKGEGHDRFAFSSWDADLFFDNLRIEPL